MPDESKLLSDDELADVTGGMSMDEYYALIDSMKRNYTCSRCGCTFSRVKAVATALYQTHHTDYCDACLAIVIS